MGSVQSSAAAPAMATMSRMPALVRWKASRMFGVLIVLILFPRGLAGLCSDLRDWALEAIVRRKGEASAKPGGPVDPVLVP